MNEQQERERFEVWLSTPFVTNIEMNSNERIAARLGWLSRASLAPAEERRDMVNTVSSDDSFDKIKLKLENRGISVNYATAMTFWNAALRYAAEQKSERDRTVDTIISAAMADIFGEREYDWQYCIERKSMAFNKIREIWRTEK